MIAHLLQSTLFAAVVWLATLALRRNHARARHALWLAASIKFLIPFSLFVSLGSQTVRIPAPPAPPQQMRFVMVDTPPVAPTPAAPAPAPRDWRPPMLWLVWACGCTGILIRWFRRWRTALAILRESTPRSDAAGVPVHSSPSALEPGVFGIFRPVLVLPEGVDQRLSPQQLQAVLAHELCHVRHHDNLAAALHMLVESIFWFHPLVWWMGARLVDERERACDEEVLQLGNDRAVYAESILRVCQLYLESPIPCVSGITGAELKQRIRNIMNNAVRQQLEPAKKLLLASLGIAAILVPLAIGFAHPASMRAQAPLTAAPLHFDAASLKPNNGDILATRPTLTAGRIRWTTQLMYLLGYAYNMEWWRIDVPSGAGNIYELEATMPPGTTNAQVRLMLQTLLNERFRMTSHRVTRQAVEGYVLSVGKDGPKMQEAKPEDPDGSVSGHLPTAGVIIYEGRNATMIQLSESLQRSLETVVLDQTGLTGKYTFDMQVTGTPKDPDNLPGALQKLGLKLDKYKGPVECLVIDHMDKLAEN